MENRFSICCCNECILLNPTPIYCISESSINSPWIVYGEESSHVPVYSPFMDVCTILFKDNSSASNPSYAIIPINRGKSWAVYGDVLFDIRNEDAHQIIDIIFASNNNATIYYAVRLTRIKAPGVDYVVGRVVSNNNGEYQELGTGCAITPTMFPVTESGDVIGIRGSVSFIICVSDNEGSHNIKFYLVHRSPDNLFFFGGVCGPGIAHNYGSAQVSSISNFHNHIGFLKLPHASKIGCRIAAGEYKNDPPNKSQPCDCWEPCVHYSANYCDLPLKLVTPSDIGDSIRNFLSSNNPDTGEDCPDIFNQRPFGGLLDSYDIIPERVEVSASESNIRNIRFDNVEITSNKGIFGKIQFDYKHPGAINGAQYFKIDIKVGGNIITVKHYAIEITNSHPDCDIYDSYLTTAFDVKVNSVEKKELTTFTFRSSNISNTFVIYFMLHNGKLYLLADRSSTLYGTTNICIGGNCFLVVAEDDATITESNVEIIYQIYYISEATVTPEIKITNIYLYKLSETCIATEVPLGRVLFQEELCNTIVVEVEGVTNNEDCECEDSEFNNANILCDCDKFNGTYILQKCNKPSTTYVGGQRTCAYSKDEIRNLSACYPASLSTYFQGYKTAPAGKLYKLIVDPGPYYDNPFCGRSQTYDFNYTFDLDGLPSNSNCTGTTNYYSFFANYSRSFSINFSEDVPGGKKVKVHEVARDNCSALNGFSRKAVVSNSFTRCKKKDSSETCKQCDESEAIVTIRTG